jgi:hypothetical protein
MAERKSSSSDIEMTSETMQDERKDDQAVAKAQCEIHCPARRQIDSAYGNFIPIVAT